MRSDDAKRLAIATWAVLGVVALLLEPAIRLARAATLRLRDGIAPAEWLALIVATVALGYVEGHRGFRCSFCPRVVDRAFELSSTPRRPWSVVIAPLWAMSLVGDSRTRMARSWLMVGMIVAMVLLVRMLPPTARAIVDAAVTVSLAWGIVELGTRYAFRLRHEWSTRARGSCRGGRSPVRA